MILYCSVISLGDIYISSLFLILELETNHCWRECLALPLWGQGFWWRGRDEKRKTLRRAFKHACSPYLDPSPQISDHRLVFPGCIFWQFSLPSQNYRVLSAFPVGHSSNSCELLKGREWFYSGMSWALDDVCKMRGNSKEPETNNDSDYFPVSTGCQINHSNHVS